MDGILGQVRAVLKIRIKLRLRAFRDAMEGRQAMIGTILVTIVNRQIDDAPKLKGRYEWRAFNTASCSDVVR